MHLNTILVEDNKTIQSTLVPALAELANSRVVAIAATAAGAKNALFQWQGRWQLIVVDLFLREGSGIEVLEAMKQEPRPRAWNQHVYVLTNYATIDIRYRCKQLGADGVYDKSTELETFFERCIGLSR